MIWKRDYTVEELNALCKNTIHDSLSIEFTTVGTDLLQARMPVNQSTIQPAGILHGGASVVLAESLGSVASNLIIDNSALIAVGQSINANHIRPGVNGFVYGTCSPVHIGKRSHVWSIEIKNESEKLVCVCRLTMAIVDKPQ